MFGSISSGKAYTCVCAFGSDDDGTASENVPTEKLKPVCNAPRGTWSGTFYAKLAEIITLQIFRLDAWIFIRMVSYRSNGKDATKTFAQTIPNTSNRAIVVGRRWYGVRRRHRTPNGGQHILNIPNVLQMVSLHLSKRPLHTWIHCNYSLCAGENWKKKKRHLCSRQPENLFDFADTKMNFASIRWFAHFPVAKLQYSPVDQIKLSTKIIHTEMIENLLHFNFMTYCIIIRNRIN